MNFSKNKDRENKYSGHIKKHNNILMAILEGKVKEQKSKRLDRNVYGKTAYENGNDLH